VRGDRAPAHDPQPDRPCQHDPGSHGERRSPDEQRNHCTPPRTDTARKSVLQIHCRIRHGMVACAALRLRFCAVAGRTTANSDLRPKRSTPGATAWTIAFLSRAGRAGRVLWRQVDRDESGLQTGRRRGCRDRSTRVYIGNSSHLHAATSAPLSATSAPLTTPGRLCCSDPSPGGRIRQAYPPPARRAAW
jgi:hypothetical protein